MKRRPSFILGFALLCILAGGWNLPATQQAQESPKPPAAREMPRPGDRTFGTVVSVGVDRLQIKQADGTEETVLVNDQTHFRQGPQQELQLEDLKPGDQIMVSGSTNEDKELQARMVRRVTREELARMPKPGEAVFGEIVSVDKGQLKLRNRRQGERVVVFNGQTTFLKEGQPITLKDLKVGDRVFATGKETNGQFIATRIVTGQLQPGVGSSDPCPKKLPRSTKWHSPLGGRGVAACGPPPRRDRSGVVAAPKPRVDYSNRGTEFGGEKKYAKIHRRPRCFSLDDPHFLSTAHLGTASGGDGYQPRRPAN